MLTVIPFHSKDKPLAALLCSWIADLGSLKKHECMLVHPPSTSPSDAMLAALRQTFSKVFILKTPDDLDGWPQGPNLLFRRAARQIEAVSPQAWLWLEPDAVPLVPYWLDEIAAAYSEVDKKRPFMGVRVELPDVIPHMSGVAVYPRNAPSLAPLLVTCNRVAFDVNGQSEVLPLLTPTDLIQHEWRPPGFATADDLKRLRAGAVLYHQCKDGSLIARLREASNLTTPQISAADKAALAMPEIQAASAGAATEEPPLSQEELITHHVGQLKNIVDAGGKDAARQVGMYLAAAGIIPSSPLAPPQAKKKAGRPPGRKAKAKHEPPPEKQGPVAPPVPL